MARYCLKCGEELKGNGQFCTGCGTRANLIQESKAEKAAYLDRASLKKAEARKNSPALISIIAIAGVAVALGIAFFIFQMQKEEKPKLEQASQSALAKETSKPASGVEKAPANSEGMIINNYAKKLNALRIHSTGPDLSVGQWKITDQNGTLFLEANHIPSKDLSRIFDLFDAGNMAPLTNWAKEVYYIAEDLSSELDKDWSIDVSNECVQQYPVTLSSSDIMTYSGTCGYSIPVLSGSDKDELSLIVYSSVFGEPNYNAPANADSSSEYMFPGSDVRRLTESELDGLNLTQLRIARNEIYARRGYIFKSADLNAYFYRKSWYLPDASFDGNSLNGVEKYNVELIESRERYLK